jgi:hypothetical protein
VRKTERVADFMSKTSADERRIQWLLFAVTFIAFAYFHQGGGWNQNVRFAMVRAIVEEGNLWIDSYMVYIGGKSEQGTRLVRIPARNAEFSLGGKDFAFAWRDTDGRTTPLNRNAGDSVRGRGGEITFVEPEQVAVSGDVSFHNGHFHPAKGPGGTFVAVPAYFLIYGFERILGMDPDDWWTLTFNAWLTSVLSVGLLSALGCILFFRLAMKFSDGCALESLLSTLTFGLGTMFFPYATAIYEHNVIAVALLSSFYLLHRVKQTDDSSGDRLPDGKARLYVYLAGLCAGYAAMTNYVMAVVVLLLGGYLLLAVRRKGGWLWFGVGLLGPFLLICAYNVVCFSTPFTTNYSYENPVFKTGENTFLDVFLLPQLEVIPLVLVSPFRGLFISSPVLLIGVYGLIGWLRTRKLRAEAWVMISIIAFLLLLITTFNGWHGGWAVGPRYLVPALPFLALPLVFGFKRFFRTTCALAVLSVAISLLISAVDPQAPVGIARNAMVDGRSQWKYSPLTEYEWPLFFEGHPWPLLDAQRDQVLRFYDKTMQANGEPALIRSKRLTMLTEEIDTGIRSGKAVPLLLTRGPDGQTGAVLSELPTVMGPVSVNPIGVYEGWMYRVFPPHSPQARWNSFNVGEFLFRGSRWSLVPLLTIVGLLVIITVRMAVRLNGDPHAF